MPKSPSDEVFLLIQSLSKPEKRYFKFYAAIGSSNENNIYRRMFDVIEAMKQYDEKKILHKIPEAKSQQLSNQKKYLRELVLDSLRIYHSRRSISAELWTSIEEIQVLYNKRFFNLCLKYITKSKIIAHKFEKYQQLAVLLTIEERILFEKASSERDEENTETVYKEISWVYQELTRYNIYKRLQNQSAKFFRKGALMIESSLIEELSTLRKHPLLKSESEAKGFYQRVCYYTIFGNIYNILAFSTFKESDWNTSYLFRKRLMKLFEKEPHHIIENPTLYLQSVNVFLISCIHTKKENELEKLFKQVMIQKKNDVFLAQINVTRNLLLCCSTVLFFYVSSGKFREGVLLLQEIEIYFNRINDKISSASQKSFYLTFSLVYFGVGNFKRSLFWLNKILNDRRSEAREDIQIVAHLFNLIIHFELGHEGQLDHFTKETYRFLSNRNRRYKTESIVRTFIRKEIPHINSHAQLLQAFKELKQKMEPLQNDPKERIVFEYFDFISWLDSKIQKRSLSEVVRKKYLSGKK